MNTSGTELDKTVPVTALMNLLMLHQVLHPGAPLFSLGSVASVLTQSSFVNQLHHHLRVHLRGKLGV